ncbi:Por secretion system C-terminal sorting domain [Chryseobacterium nakagawai]|uniref:T9SS C-terminal target domain-containing protein n=1 Tax=Chryseobacterium nakagawai TaxID=1241982 RepID=A0AAD0YQY3_CHRNA|nr:zinc-dependent metalloprotease family protein [Chryseobacterium nakagawai]AZA91486.1 T9SS C-terminal target domain-containing protein [Chryseobacterium nakagawai]VEH23080.1 Por secretion system C-terminal sorting domain [Chryseobacterium nakagawai]
MKKRILLVCALAAGLSSFNAQRWTPASQKTSEVRKEVEVQYSYRLDLQSLRNTLKDAVERGRGAQAVVISLPTAEGKIEKFAVYSDPIVEKSMADRYQLGSYVGVGVDDPGKYVRFSTAPTQMQSMIIKDGKFQFIEPISTDKQVYGVFYKTKRTEGEHGFECTTEEKNFKDIKALELNGKNSLSNVGITSRPSSTTFRTYRLALSTTGEYTKKFDPTGGITNTVIQMHATMDRVNGVFQKDFGVKLIMKDLPGIIFTDPASDPYTGNLNLQLQQTLTSQVGNDNYDIGHVFNAAGGNGNAGGIGVMCVNPASSTALAKGSAFTQNTNPMGDSFDIDYVAHEMGHQLGGNHTFSNKSEGSGANVEPGGGTTIMGYAGITSDNVAMASDAYFHYKSIDQILTSLEGKSGCGTSEAITNNTPPTIGELTAYTVPKGTAYYLDASATDAEGDALTYTWEQNDSVDDFASISGDSGWGYNPQGALTRSYFGTASGRRYFPSLPVVMSGNLTNKTVWETVSYIPRTLTYAVTVRDQNAMRPMVSSKEINTVVGNDGPFKFNGITTSSVLYRNANNVIQWEVANTNQAPYNSSNVKIEYTTDLVNGATWTELVASTPNNGSYTVQMPSTITTPIKLRVSAIGNVFYAVSPTITVADAPTSTTLAPTGVSTINTEVFKTTARVSWNSVPGATYSINYRKGTTSNWSNVLSQTNNVVLAGLEDETNYEVQVAAVVNTVPGAFSNNYTFKTKGLTTGVDYCILNSGIPDFGMVYQVSLNSTAIHTDGTFRAYKDVSDNPAKTINLVKGTTYSLDARAVVSSAYSQMSGRQLRINAWIDYNRNGVFEDTERIFGLGSNNAQVNAAIGGAINFTVPATAYSGDKTLRMRVVGKYGNTDLSNPCVEIPSGAGGVMDLPVKITETLGTDEVRGTKASSEVSLYPNPADTFVEVKNLKGKADYKIYSADGRLVQEGQIDGQRINVASLIKGMYVVTIKDDKNTYNTKLIKK